MTRSEAEAILGMVTGTWDMQLDADGTGSWMAFLAEHPFAQSMSAYTRLRDRQKERPTIADLRRLIIEATVVVPVEEDVLPPPEVEPWVVAWAVARYKHGDMRVLPQQKPGYDALQTANPYQRTYVWPDQELMDDEAVSAYVAAGTGLSVDDVFRAIGV